MNNRVRQFHRWMSMAFTLAVITNVIVNFAMVGQEQLALWVGVATLVPLALLMLTGLYLFALPYAAKWRSGQSAGSWHR